MTDSTRPQKLSDQDVSYLKLLHSLKASGTGSENEMGVVRRIAAWITSTTVLTAICRVQRWYDDWAVKESLVRNDFTPAAVKPHLETKVAIFDLLRELDDSELTDADKAEIRDSIRELTATLPEHDRGVVKNRAYELSSSRRPKPPGEERRAGEIERRVGLPDTRPEGQRTERREGRPDRREIDVSAEDLDLLIDFDESDLSAEPAATVESPPQVEQPPSTETKVAPAAKERAEDVDLNDLSFLDSLLGEKLAREELGIANPEDGGSIRLRREDLGLDELELASDIPDSPALDRPPPDDDEEDTADDLQFDFDLDDETDDGAVEEQPPVAPAVEPEPVQPAAKAPVADKLSLAATSGDRQVLATLLHEPESIQMALLANPALNDQLAATLARKAGTPVLKQIHRNRRLFMRPMVQMAFTENPNASSAALLEVVNSMGNVKNLVKLLHNPKVKFLEVKSKARSRLTNVFKAMSTGEKLAAVRQSGRPLLKQLWREFFRDEPLVLACLREKQLDQGIILEISRSSIAPRKALEQIGKTPAWVNNKQVCMALVQNPKTPRPLIPQLVRKLSPAERNQIKRNPSLPGHIRAAVR